MNQTTTRGNPACFDWEFAQLVILEAKDEDLDGFEDEA